MSSTQRAVPDSAIRGKATGQTPDGQAKKAPAQKFPFTGSCTLEACP